MVFSLTREGASNGYEQHKKEADEVVAGGQVGDLHDDRRRRITQAEAARKWRVDVSTVITIRRTVKDAALAALSRRPGRPAKQRNFELEEAQDEIVVLTGAIKAQAIELAIVRGKAGWG